jgi:hypothetical protein
MSHRRKRVNTAATRKPSWRDILPIHPAAELFPLMTPAELHELSEDIKTNGLQIPITVMVDKRGDEWTYQLIDGRNRLDAIELAGFNTIAAKRSAGRAARRKVGMECGLDTFLGLPGMNDTKVAINYISPPDDVYAFVASANVHRRHLTAEQKHDLIAKVIKATPEKSDRQIAEATKSNRTTVGQIRKTLEKAGDVSIVDTRTDSKGREQPAHKASTAKPAAATSTTTTCDDIGPASTSEMARKDAEIEELRNAKRRLEIKIAGLENEAKAAAKSSPESKSGFRCSICHEKTHALLRPVFICDGCVDIHEVREAIPPPDDGLDIPKSLLRDKQRETTP